MVNFNSVNTALFDKIVATIAKNGPLSLASYISYALDDPDHGYYQTKDPFGKTGDFTTAPEISGLFGEMCGLYLAHIAQLSGLSNPAIFEFGPGRGSLITDMRHVWQHVMPSLTTAPVHLLETSPTLRCVQRRRLSDATLFFHEDLGHLPAQPIFSIANEFFDTLPVAQAIWRQNQNNADGIWRHRLVGFNDGRLEFVDGPPLHSDEAVDWALEKLQSGKPNQPSNGNIPDGTIAEYCPLASTYAGRMANHLAAYGGACLIIDYGRNGQSGDSLQAVANHQPVDVFYQPGNADLSHWVDFSAIHRAAKEGGARLIGPITQGEFLRNIGIIQRGEAAAKLADAATRRSLFAAVDRLVSNQQMGSAFKVALMLPPGNGSPPGFATNSTGADAS
jgi:NADH dehydrogenase [ubiquinone] 1 alpha subcomplex assembly factor 7